MNPHHRDLLVFMAQELPRACIDVAAILLFLGALAALCLGLPA